VFSIAAVPPRQRAQAIFTRALTPGGI